MPIGSIIDVEVQEFCSQLLIFGIFVGPVALVSSTFKMGAPGLAFETWDQAGFHIVRRMKHSCRFAQERFYSPSTRLKIASTLPSWRV